MSDDQTVPCCIDCAAGRPCLSGCVRGERNIPRFALTPQSTGCAPGNGRFGHPDGGAMRLPAPVIPLHRPPPPLQFVAPVQPMQPGPPAPPPYQAVPAMEQPAPPAPPLQFVAPMQPMQPGPPAPMAPIAFSPAGQAWSMPVAQGAYGQRPEPWNAPPMPTWASGGYVAPAPPRSVSHPIGGGTAPRPGAPKPTNVRIDPNVLNAMSTAMGQGTQLILGTIQSNNQHAIAELQSNTQIRLAEIQAETARTANAEQRAQLETQMTALRQLLEAAQTRQTELVTPPPSPIIQQPAPQPPSQTNTAMWVAVAVLGAVVVGGGVYLATREKPRRNANVRRNYYGTSWE